jgi:hypothetical protein
LNTYKDWWDTNIEGFKKLFEWYFPEYYFDFKNKDHLRITLEDIFTKTQEIETELNEKSSKSEPELQKLQNTIKTLESNVEAKQKENDHL